MEMSEAEMDQLLGYLDKYGLAATSEAWGLTEEEIKDIYPAMEMLDSKDDDEWNPDGSDDIPLEQVYLDSYPEDEIVSEWEPDYSKTAEYEGTGITSELIPGEGLVAPILAGMGVDPTTAAVIGSVATKKPGMLTNKLFASKKLKANQKANRGTEGPVVQGASRTAKNTNLRPSIKDKTAARYKSMSNRVKAKNATNVVGATTAATILGTGINRGLQGNRNAQGDFTVYDEEALDPPTGPDMVPETVPETMGNQYGYHKQEGQNFWTVNNDDSYWDTHEMGTGDAWSDADVKEVVQELDWSSWFK